MSSATKGNDHDNREPHPANVPRNPGSCRPMTPRTGTPWYCANEHAMSTIGGPGGIGGPQGPEAPDGPPKIDDIDDVASGAPVELAHGTAPARDIEALATEIAAGRLTQREAIDRLVEATAGPALGATERAELRELLTELVANDPYLGGLVGRI
jgi:hypothetical protein